MRSIAERCCRVTRARGVPRAGQWFEIFEVDDHWTFDPANAEKVKLTAPN
jgi:hypothetical protein